MEGKEKRKRGRERGWREGEREKVFLLLFSRSKFFSHSLNSSLTPFKKKPNENFNTAA